MSEIDIEDLIARKSISERSGFAVNNIYSEEEIEWLLKQAEKVEELEAQNKWYCEAMSHYGYDDLEEQNKRYREALEFYSNSDNYELETHSRRGLTSEILDDDGLVAFKALEEGESHE